MYSELNLSVHSGCKDEQTSADVGSAATFHLPANVGPGGAGGACTNAMMSIFYKSKNIVRKTF